MLAFLFAVLPQPIDLDRLDLQRARAMSGRPVVASFVVAKPPYVYDRPGVTDIGAASVARSCAADGPTWTRGSGSRWSGC